MCGCTRNQSEPIPDSIRLRLLVGGLGFTSPFWRVYEKLLELGWKDPYDL